MKKQLINKYKSYIADAESKMATEKDPENISVLAVCVYCYKDILRDLERPNPVTDKQLERKFEATYEPNMIYPDTKEFVRIAKEYAGII